MAQTSKSSYVKVPRQVCLGRRAVGQDFCASRLRCVVGFEVTIGHRIPSHAYGLRRCVGGAIRARTRQVRHG